MGDNETITLGSLTEVIMHIHTTLCKIDIAIRRKAAWRYRTTAANNTYNQVIFECESNSCRHGCSRSSYIVEHVRCNRDIFGILDTQTRMKTVMER